MNTDINKPRWLQGIAVLLWGATTDLILFAIPMAIALEARYLIRHRFDLERNDFYQVANLTSIGLVGLVAWLIWGPRTTHFIIALTELLPLLFFPLVVVLAFSTLQRMPLDVLFYSLRRQEQSVTQSWDMDYVFLGICLVGAGTRVAGELIFLPAAGLIIAGALFRLRSARFSTRAWVLTVAIALLGSIYMAQALRAMHIEVKERSTAWFLDMWRTRNDPFRTRTALGAIGELKLSDEILFRVEPIGSSRLPRLLQEATYDSLDVDTWLTLPSSPGTVPMVDDFVWQVREPTATDSAMQLYLEFDRDRALVPVPPSVTVMRDLPAQSIRRSRFGTIEAHGLVPSPGFRVDYAAGLNINSAPERMDLVVETHRPLFRQLFGELAFDDDHARLRFVRDWFADGFHYTLTQSGGDGDPMTRFLTQTRAGHCEYFATATVLMLRHLGIPARYAVGFALEEQVLGMTVVRRRHAHAWAIAWIDGAWTVIDTTPGTWLAEEAAGSSPFRPLADLADHLLFRYRLWWDKQALEDYQPWLVGFGVLLALVLAIRLYRSESVVLDAPGGDPAGNTRPGADSPFYKVINALAASGFMRDDGESLVRWVTRIGHPELLPLVAQHYRRRFDPAYETNTEDDAEGDALGQNVDAWLAREHALQADPARRVSG